MAALSLLAAGTLYAAPQAQAATCTNIPGGTPGLDISVGGQPQRVPSITGISVCVETGAVPLVSVTFDGRGYCTWSCISVVVPGGNSTLASMTLSYREDGVLKSTTAGGTTVPGGSEACLLSVGAPDAPYPTCYPGVGLGIDGFIDEDPTNGILETVQREAQAAEATVRGAVENAVTTMFGYVDYVNETVNDLGEDLGGRVEDEKEYAENHLNNTVLPLVDSYAEIICGEIPPMYWQDGHDWYSVEFCDDPVTWLSHSPDAPCNQVLPWYWDDENYEYVGPCNDTVRWAQLFVENGGEVCYERICAGLLDPVRTICGMLRDDVSIRDCQ